MSASHHPERLTDYLAGRLGEAEEAAVEAHLADCDDCLEEVDRLWTELAREDLGGPIPELDAASADHLERRLLQRIHLADLASQAVRFVTEGFTLFLLTFLRPFLGRGTKERDDD